MNVVPFSFESHSVRAIVGENGEPIFVAVDVCACLEIANARDAVAGLDEDEKGVATIDTPGGPQKMGDAPPPAPRSPVSPGRAGAMASAARYSLATGGSTRPGFEAAAWTE